MKKDVIICVDDESIVLTSVKSQLRRHLGDAYGLEMFTSAEEALETMEEFREEGTEVPVVISDHIMPGMKGDQFLIAVSVLMPRALRILLTGQASAQAVGNAVNQANLYRYISKPWDEVDLQMTVTEALRSYRQDKRLEEQNAQLKELNENLEGLVEKRTRELILERERSERLLLNMIPESVALRLKQKDAVVMDSFESVSALFADIVGFTQLSLKIAPTDMLEILNHVFDRYDGIMQKHGCERLRTMGDGYFAVCGAPLRREHHVEDMALAALEMRGVVDNMPGRIISLLPPGTTLSIRIGLNCGPAVCGIVGIRKWQYDAYGDTINTAARMESHGQPGKIQVSQEFVRELSLMSQSVTVDEHTGTIRLLTARSTGLTLVHRGQIEVKGKGTMNTYFLEEH